MTAHFRNMLNISYRCDTLCTIFLDTENIFICLPKTIIIKNVLPIHKI